METLTNNSTVILHNGLPIPHIGFGVFRVQEGQDVESAVHAAIKTGYRLIDTAMIYANESGVGQVIKDCGVPREELFITTKLWNSDQGYESALKAIDVSLAKLGLEYVDLYLVHWPTASGDVDPATNTFFGVNKREETWKAMEEIYKSGKAKAIGVSNYTIKHLEEMKSYAMIQPMVNQVEFHPFLYQKDLLEYCQAHHIVLEAHSPLAPIADPKTAECRNPGIDAIAHKHGKAGAQVLLRWSVQHGVIPLPKSVHESRIQENFDIFNFSLDDEDMKSLDAMNLDLYVRRDPTTIE